MQEMFAPYLFLGASLLVAEFQDELSLIFSLKLCAFFRESRTVEIKTQKEKVHTLQTMNLGKLF